MEDKDSFEKIQPHVVHLESRYENLKQFRDTVATLENDSYDVSVSAPEDSPFIRVDVYGDKVTDELEALRKLATSRAKIKYDYSTDTYSLTAQFNTEY